MELDLSIRIDEQRNLLLTEIGRKTFEEQALYELDDDDCGLFLVLEDKVAGTSDVLAKVASEQAGQALIRLMARASPRLAVV